MTLGVCSFCGEITEGRIAFYAADESNVCAACVEKFSGVISDYLEAKAEMKNKAVVTFPVEDRNKLNFKVIEGGKSE